MPLLKLSFSSQSLFDVNDNLSYISNIDSVFVQINENNPLYEDKQLLVGEGIYSGSPDTELNVLVCNHSNKIWTIPKNCMIGWSTQVNPGSYIDPGTSLNELESKVDPPEQRDLSLLSQSEKS